MIKINTENYEAYLLDLMEGKLSETDKSALMAFLDANPGLKETVDFSEGMALTADTVLYENKKSLYRGELNAENIEWYLAAQAEGDTSAEENALIEKFFELHPKWKKQQHLFSLAKLTADESIRLENKSSLYKTKTVSLFQRRAFYYAAAAVIAILLVTGYLLFETNQPEELTAQNQLPLTEIHKNETDRKISAPEDTLQPSLQNEPELPKDKIEKSNPNFSKPLKPVYRIIENRPLIAENKMPEPSGQNELPPTSEVVSAPEVFKSSDQFYKLESIRHEISQLIADNPNAFVPGAFDKLIERLADGETEISKTELQQLLVNQHTSNPVNPATSKTPLLDAVAWSLNKISGKNVSLEKKFNDEGRLVAYELDAGLFRIGKEE